MKKIVMILMAVALVALPTMAQTFGNQEQPNVQFQSTSTLQGSGSAYSATPALNANGTAMSPAKAPASAPLKSGTMPPKPGAEGGDNTPVGDAVLPLTLMALAYALVVFFRKRKETVNR